MNKNDKKDWQGKYYEERKRAQTASQEYMKAVLALKECKTYILSVSNSDDDVANTLLTKMAELNV